MKPSQVETRESANKARMAGQATEWEVKGDLLLLRPLGLAEPVGWGRGAVWRFLKK